MIDRGAGLVALARLRVVVVGAFLGGALLVVPATATAVAAANDGLALSTATTYTLVPDDHVVRAVVDVTALNQKPNRVSGGVTTRYFYDGFRLGIQTEARAVRATAGGVSLAVSTTTADGYLRVDVRLRHSIFFNESARARVTFELPGGEPRSKSEVRVGPAFATFVAWAFGDSGSVRIVVPSDFDTATTGSDVTQVTSGSSTLITAAVTDVSSWYVVVNADRSSKLTDVDVRLRGGEELRIQAWPDDPSWKREVTDLLTRGLPELVDLTGLPWPVTGSIAVHEVHTPLLEGYAGVFYPDLNKIEISEDLDDLTIVHEASHAWFNSRLFEGRWIDEGFADTYASQALDRLGLGGFRPDNVVPGDPAGVKLNDWVAPGRITDDATDAREAFGYNASWTVIRKIVDEVGVERMRDVLARADGRLIAYRGAGDPEPVGGSNDWRRLLDLVDQVGGSTTADGLFRTWVVSSADLAALDQRDAARTAYAALVHHGIDWLPPYLVREPMSDWSFDLATARIADAETVLKERDAIADQAGDMGLTVPADLRAAYEGANRTFDDAKAIASRELDQLAGLQAATDAVDAPRDPLVALGLTGSDPELRLAAARNAFDTGAADTEAQARAVVALIGGAAEAGRQRLFVGIVGLDGLFGLVVLIALARRRQRRRRAAQIALAAASATSVASVADLPPEAPDEIVPTDPPGGPPADPSATLAAPEPPPFEPDPPTTGDAS